MEQGEAANIFMDHSNEESQFFLILIQLAKAGTPALKRRIQMQISQILEKRLILRERLGIAPGLNTEAQAEFYSSWIYGIIHVILTIPELQNAEAISKYLGLSVRRVGEILDFLVSVGLAIKAENNRYDIGTARIHLGSDSPLISKFHTNWRVKAIQSLEKESASDDLHYSSAITVSKEDAIKIKSILIKYIQEIKLIVRDSSAEVPFCFNIDFFKI